MRDSEIANMAGIFSFLANCTVLVYKM